MQKIEFDFKKISTPSWMALKQSRESDPCDRCNLRFISFKNNLIWKERLEISMFFGEHLKFVFSLVLRFALYLMVLFWFTKNCESTGRKCWDYNRRYKNFNLNWGDHSTWYGIQFRSWVIKVMATLSRWKNLVDNESRKWGWPNAIWLPHESACKEK